MQVQTETLIRRLSIVSDELIKAAQSGEFSPLDIANIANVGMRLAQESNVPGLVFCAVEIDSVCNDIAKRMRNCEYPTEK